MVPAGHSHPLDLSKVLGNLQKENLCLCLSSSLLTALTLSVTWAAKVDLWMMPSSMLNQLLLQLKRTIPTKVTTSIDLHAATKMTVLFSSLVSKMSKLTTLINSLLPSLNSLSLSLSKLTRWLSNLTPPVLSQADVVLPSITEFSQSATALRMVLTTSSSRTHGDPLGETTDTSRLPALPERELAESRMAHLPTLLSEPKFEL